MAGIFENGWKQLRMARGGFKWMECMALATNSLTLLYMAGMAEHCFK